MFHVVRREKWMFWNTNRWPHYLLNGDLSIDSLGASTSSIDSSPALSIDASIDGPFEPPRLHADDQLIDAAAGRLIGP